MILNSENPIRMVRELKGAPLSILMVLTMVHQRVLQGYLERATGYTDKPISKALAYMREVGLVDETCSGWQLIKEKVMQLPLILELEEDNSSSNKGIDPSNKGFQPLVIQPDDVQLSRNNSDSLITTTLSNNELNSSVVVISNNETIRKNSEFEANLEEFKQCGISRNKRTESLASMRHVTPPYIRAHLKALNKNDSKGLAIMRMEQAENPPKTLIKLTERERINKYSEWEK